MPTAPTAPSPKCRGAFCVCRALPVAARKMQTKATEAEIEAQWRNSLTTPRRVVEETLKTQECRQAAQWLAQQLHTTGLQPKDVMVLSRKRERLSLMQAELAALHIPAQQPEKTELGDMPEVQDLVALLDVLVSPAHNLSLAQVLKSPLFGVDDAALVQLVLCLRRLRAALPAEAAALLNWWQVLQQAPDLPAALAPVGAVLAQWKQWVSTLPPHDALGAIYQHGDVLARYAAATPAHQREGVLTNLRALQAAALQVDGGRYTTAYALVRALRAGGIAAPVRADADAMRLLTVHGSKGLEAPLVLMLDTDSPRAKSETMGVLVDWPGEAAQPQRFVFLASESAPPACVADMLAVEQTARRREELNTLYVALTRARHTLVLSSTEPRHANTGSWWQRLEAHASDAPVAETPVGGLVAADSQVPYTLVSLPKNEFSHNIGASWGAYGAEEVAVVESVESRIGQALHRLLERLPVRPASLDTRPAALWSADQCEAVAAEFALEPAQMARAVDMAQAIVQGEGAWAWDSRELLWHGNEVALVWEGRLLRIDRLVQRRATDVHGEAGGQWWVLDYKSSAQPQQQPELRAQLWTYRAAVMQAYPCHTVRAAFLTPQGTLIELNNP
jgi:ATP-dependent helicase/nuclease subunit A